MSEEEKPVSVMTLWRCKNPDRALQTQRSYAENNREELNRNRRDYRRGNPEILQRQWLKQAYGVTLEWYKAKFEEQDGKCDICGRPATVQQRRLAVDHNHKTGKVRGLLCIRCNVLLEKVESAPDFIPKALEYLKKYEE